MKFRPSLLALGALAAMTLAPAAIAHPRLVSATPAANAAVAPTTTIKLDFSERLTPKLSSATLVMTGMPGMKDHPPMKMPATSQVAADGKSIVLTSARPLVRGTYRVDWVVIGADTHRITGTHAFTVK